MLIPAPGDLMTRLRRYYRWRAATVTALGTTVAVLLFLLFVRNVLGWEFEEATRSPLAADAAFGPAYGGWLGSFGVMGWTLATAISGFGAALMGRRGHEQEAAFLWASTALSAILLFDDLFMVHSTLAPQLLGVSKPRALLGILILALIWSLIFSRRLVADPDLPILVWAAGWYALALWIDGFGHLVGWGGVREEVAKLIGVAAWLVFFWRTTLRSIERTGPRDGPTSR